MHTVMHMCMRTVWPLKPLFVYRNCNQIPCSNIAPYASKDSYMLASSQADHAAHNEHTGRQASSILCLLLNGADAALPDLLLRLPR